MGYIAISAYQVESIYRFLKSDFETMHFLKLLNKVTYNYSVTRCGAVLDFYDINIGIVLSVDNTRCGACAFVLGIYAR